MHEHSSTPAVGHQDTSERETGGEQARRTGRATLDRMFGPGRAAASVNEALHSVYRRAAGSYGAWKEVGTPRVSDWHAERVAEWGCRKSGMDYLVSGRGGPVLFVRADGGTVIRDAGGRKTELKPAASGRAA